VDWLAESYAGFQPFSIGSLFIYGSHHQSEPPEHQIPLKIDAATAFGSGEHGTTAGCLEFLEELAAQKNTYHNILDMGCGSGILAIAAWKLWQTNLLAVDIEQEAIIVTKRHMTFNDVPDEAILCVAGDGFALPIIAERQPFDLIIANILAGTLKEMADDIARNSGPQTKLLLSGILKEQAGDIQKHYEGVGFTLIAEKQREGWSTLLMGKTIHSYE
jgi:ribosomal protein L11 methyltransferase